MEGKNVPIQNKRTWKQRLTRTRRKLTIAMRRFGRWLSRQLAWGSEKLAPLAAKFRVWRADVFARIGSAWRRMDKSRRLLTASSGGLVLAAIVILLIALPGRGAQLSQTDEGPVANVRDENAAAAALAAAAFDLPATPNPLEEEALTKGMEAEIVLLIQERLMELEYMDFDDATTLYGPITSEAVRTFQRHNDLPDDGKCGIQTYEVLMSEGAKPYIMQRGDHGDDVREVQARLYSLGYLTAKGAVDGKFGETTEEAIKEFQQNNKLRSVDGKVGARTLEALYDESPVSRVLQRGDKDAEVVTLKRRLKILGYYTGDESSRFDSTLATAVKEFQQKNGLQRDGCVGPETKQLMMSADAQPMVLMVGDSGDKVKQVQRELAKLKYLSSANVTGYFGEKTEEAVQEFQHRNGLSDDGKVGKKTLDKLTGGNARAAATAKPTAKPATPKPNSKETPKPNNNTTTGTKPDVAGKKGVDKLIAVAESRLGCKYVRGAKGPSSFDCSGFVFWCLKESGVSVNYMTSFAWRSTTKFKRIDKLSDVRAGDIIVHRMSATKGHVAIAISNTMMIDASSSNGKVVKRSSQGNWSQKNFYCAYRIF
ncbi:MAG: peptidoglycan-binding protein [Clostridiales bacterium]|nr:peptidoglycan-binding protein [Clostridiales bacterium]